MSNQSSFARRTGSLLTADGVDVFQVNVGYRCNLECKHCHIGAGPGRTEMMSKDIMDRCLDVLRDHPIPVVDVTGGSPEMHPHIRWFLRECSALKRRLIVRTNGVVLLDERFRDLIDLYEECRIELFLSVPHPDPRMADSQRGAGVFAGLMEVMRELNVRGYGQKGTGLVLNLVHNPVGAFTPASQSALEAHYRKMLGEREAVMFNHLYCIVNMPIGRYLEYLRRTDNYKEYTRDLMKTFNESALDKVMCKTTISVGWDGRLYDCDFNQTMGLPVDHGAPDHIEKFDMDRLSRRRIVVGDHCYGCAAGAGSSCQGETV